MENLLCTRREKREEKLFMFFNAVFISVMLAFKHGEQLMIGIVSGTVVRDTNPPDLFLVFTKSVLIFSFFTG